MICDHPNLKSFTFSNGDTMTRCPDCAYGVGHYEQSIPSGESLYSVRGKKRIIVEDNNELTEVNSPTSEEMGFDAV
jgi:hypothetical protein